MLPLVMVVYGENGEREGEKKALAESKKTGKTHRYTLNVTRAFSLSMASRSRDVQHTTRVSCICFCSILEMCTNHELTTHKKKTKQKNRDTHAPMNKYACHSVSRHFPFFFVHFFFHSFLPFLSRLEYIPLCGT